MESVEKKFQPINWGTIIKGGKKLERNTFCKIFNSEVIRAYWLLINTATADDIKFNLGETSIVYEKDSRPIKDLQKIWSQKESETIKFEFFRIFNFIATNYYFNLLAYHLCNDRKLRLYEEDNDYFSGLLNDLEEINSNVQARNNYIEKMRNELFEYGTKDKHSINLNNLIEKISNLEKLSKPVENKTDDFLKGITHKSSFINSGPTKNRKIIKKEYVKNSFQVNSIIKRNLKRDNDSGEESFLAFAYHYVFCLAIQTFSESFQKSIFANQSKFLKNIENFNLSDNESRAFRFILNLRKNKKEPNQKQKSPKIEYLLPIVLYYSKAKKSKEYLYANIKNTNNLYTQIINLFLKQSKINKLKKNKIDNLKNVSQHKKLGSRADIYNLLTDLKSSIFLNPPKFNIDYNDVPLSSQYDKNDFICPTITLNLHLVDFAHNFMI